MGPNVTDEERRERWISRQQRERKRDGGLKEIAYRRRRSIRSDGSSAPGQKAQKKKSGEALQLLPGEEQV